MSAIFLNSCSQKPQPVKTIQKQYIKQSITVVKPKANTKKHIDQRHKVALLIPMSGQHKIIGENALKACLLAAKHYPNNNIIFKIFDIEKYSNKENLLATHLKNEQIDLIIGPIFYHQAKLYHKLLKNVPMFSLSNNQKISERNLFVCGLSAEEELFTIFSYAFLNKFKKFAIFVPYGQYGDIVVQIANDTFSKFYKNEIPFFNIVRYTKLTDDDVYERLQNLTIDAVFFAEPQFSKSISLPVPIFTTRGVININTESENDIYFSSTTNKTSTPLHESFLIHQYGIPSTIDMIAYDIVKTFCTSLEDKNQKHKDVLKTLYNRKLLGNIGYFSIHKNGKIHREWNILNVKN